MKSKKNFIRFFGALGLTVLFPTLIVLLLWTPSSFASEGVVEISQKNVPLVITRSGSYRLISNLTVSIPNVTAISIDANNVTIDLNGFTISGPGAADEFGDNPGFGIANKPERSVDNVVVRGGTVQDFDLGVHLPGMNNRVENTNVFGAQFGIFVGKHSVIRQCQIAHCSYEGINTDDGTMVLSNTIYYSYCGIKTSGDASPPVGGVMVMGNNVRRCIEGIRARGQGNRIEGNTITRCITGIFLEGSENYFAKNLLQGNGTALIDEGDDNTDGSTIDAALSNIIITTSTP